MKSFTPICSSFYFLLLAILTALNTSISAQPICVTTSQDVVSAVDGQISLREAINMANATSGQDTICFDNSIDGNTILLNIGSSNEDSNFDGDLDITDEDGLVILGNGMANTVIDGDSTERIFDHFAGNLVLLDLTLQNGQFRSNSLIDNGGGAIQSTITSPADIALINCAITQCFSLFRGGGILILNDQGNLIRFSATGCTFDSNKAENFIFDSGGGAISLDANNVDILIDNCEFLNNQANGGGAVQATNASGSLEVINSHFEDNLSGINKSNLGGGAIYIEGSSVTTTVENSTFESNEANTGGHGGAIRLATNSSTATFNNLKLKYNQAASLGGAISIEGQSTEVSISTCSIDTNSASYGGALHFSNSEHSLECQSTLFSGNSASVDGGGFRSDSEDAVVKFTNSTFSGNTSGRHGGAMALNNTQDVDLNFSTVTDNTSNFGNSTAGDGGGVALTGNGANCEVTFANSIVQGNIATGYPSGDNCADPGSSGGTFISASGNVFGTDPLCPVDAGDVTAPALLDALADNGGPTLTHKLQAGSAALDLAQCGSISNDQRGFARLEPCDAGAYDAFSEFTNCLTVNTALDAVDGNTSSITDLQNTPGADGKISLREAITAANNTSGLDTICFDPGINSDTILLNIGSTHEDQNADGDLDILDDLVLLGNGKDQTIIDGDSTERVFDHRDGDLLLFGLSIQHGYAIGNGGGLQSGVSNTSHAKLLNVQLISNEATLEGGGAYFGSTNEGIDMRYASFIDNLCGNTGGGLHFEGVDGKETYLAYCEFLNNNAAFEGGGMRAERSNGILHMDSCLFDGNQAGRDGGGMELNSDDGVSYLNACIVTNNTTNQNGAGISTNQDDNGSTQISHSTFYNNTAGSNGGAIEKDDDGSPMYIINSTISGNSSGQAGGGIFNSDATAGDLFLNFVTLTDNETNAESTGGGAIGSFFFQDTFLFIQNSIIQGNIDQENATQNDFSDQLLGLMVSLGGNVFGTSVLSPTGPDDTNDPANLSPLADNGGYTLTHALGTGSSAINLANCDTITLDQRGEPRSDGFCDAGAFEGNALELAPCILVTTTSDIVDGNTSSKSNLISNPGIDGKISLREAITAANNTSGLDTICFDSSIDGDTIVLDIGSSREDQNLDGDLDITDPMGLVVQGNGADKTFIDGNLTERVFHHDGQITIENLTIQNGNELVNSSSGGALYSRSNASALRFIQCTFENNTARGGGAIYVSSSSPLQYFHGCTFLNNRADDFDGGAIRIYAGSNSKANLFSCEFYDNQTHRDAGALAYLSTAGTLNLQECFFERNTADGDGGAIDANPTNGNIIITTSQFVDNNCIEKGGALHIENFEEGSTIINQSSFLQNISGEDGGGIYLGDASPMSIWNSTISENRTDGNGAGIAIGAEDTEIHLNFVTLFGNIADHDNDSNGDGGGIDLTTASSSTIVYISNSILQGNQDLSNSNFNDCSNSGGAGIYISEGGNVFGDQTGCPETDDDTSEDAMLEALADYGGSTWTNRLPQGSAAINFANCDTTQVDQRGVKRDDSHCDAGAYERSSSEDNNCLMVNTTYDIIDGDTSSMENLLISPGPDGKISLREAVSAANNTPGGDTICFDVSTIGDTILLDRVSTYENANLNGDLDIDDKGGLTIIGNGQDLTIIDGNEDDRILDVHSGDFQLHDVTIQNGLALDQLGGGIRTDKDSSSTFISHTVIRSNCARGGGGIRFDGLVNSIDMIDCSIVHNEAYGGSGGGIGYSVTKGVLELERCTVNYNQSFGGGGLYSSGLDANMMIDQSVISGNKSISDNEKGGGIRQSSTHCVWTIENSEVSNNAAGRGGGIAVTSTDGLTTIINTTISGNEAIEDGGGVTNDGTDGTILLNYVTITDNLADSDQDGIGDGGGVNILKASSKISLENSIVQGNDDGTPAETVFNDCANTQAGQLNTLGHNIFGSGTGCPTILSDGSGDATLDTLKDNGGFARTHALILGSAAIDFASCDTILADQRGLARPVSSDCDAGAYEGVYTSGRSWVGSASSDWEDEDNWAEKLVPATGNEVIIGNALHDPTIGAGISAFCGMLSIESDGFLNIKNQGSLVVNDDTSTLFEAMNSGRLQVEAGGVLTVEPE